jgi:UDP-N-acetylglucosamine--N-acetylmuramyl-(pentapeptide) pyrophosphoryl-undecaprenol N-acetylglucosamine transferase
MTYAFAAAGTGGHVYPAIAVARSLVGAGVEPDDIIFFGGDRLEASVVPDAGFRLVQLEIRGLKRSLSVDNLKLPAIVRRAAAQVASTLAARSRGALIVFGGYVTVPAAAGARKIGMPYIIHEQNAVPGVANRFVARRAARTFVAFANARDRLPDAELVGNPLGAGFEHFDGPRLRVEARRGYALDPDRPVIGIVGGSQGAQVLNEIAVETAETSDRDYSVLHLTGTGHHDVLARRAIAVDGWVTKPFEHDMASFYAAADLVLSRAGAMTVSELAATATPSVVVPLPAGRGYQAMNAHDLDRAGGTVIVDQDRIADVPDLLRRLIRDPARRARMEAGARSVARTDAASRVARALMETADV